MGDKPEARELLDLDVSEVSLVDSPANLREFLVVKRLENNMGAFETDSYGIDPSQIGMPPQTPSASSSGGDSGGGDTISIEKAAASLVGDLTQVSELLAKEEIEKQIPADLKTAISRVMQFLGKVAGGKYPSPGAKSEKSSGKDDVEKARRKKEEEEEMAKRHEIEASLFKAGKLKEDEKDLKARQKKEKEELAKAGKKDGDEEKDGKKKDVQKSADDGEAPAVQIMEDGRVIVAGQPVSKARAFTAQRTGTIKTVLMSLATLLKDVDEESLKSVITDIGKGASLPGDPKIEGGVQPAGTDGVQKSVEEVTKLLAGLGTRLEAIEKTRSPSTSVENEGGSDTKTKVEKSFWHGVL